MDAITSLHNPRIKQILLLMEKSRERRQRHLFVIEGRRELEAAMRAGYTVETLLVCPQICRADTQALKMQCKAEILEISVSVFERLAYRDSSDGLLAIAQQKTHHLSELQLSPQPLIIVIEAVEKPGNLGAIVRTADAARADAVIVCEPQCEVYNPNAIRASTGAIFTVPVACCTSQEALDFLLARKVQIFAATPHAMQYYHTADFSQAAAIVFGAEAAGLTDFWLNGAHCRIKIPMLGTADSLNVSTSAAVIVFEAMRQRGFEPTARL